MRNRVFAALAGLSLLTSTAFAADNYTIQSGGATRTVRATEIGGVLYPNSIQVDGTGAERFTTGNAGYVRFPSGTVLTLGAGSAAIGTVGVTALPALPAGSNAIGTVGVTALPALPAGANAIGTVGVTALPALPAGSNAIGSVTVNSLPATAATAAKQPSLGTAGTPSADVLSVQGVSGGTPQNTDTVVRSTATNRGGVLTTASTAVTLIPANANRRGAVVQNRNAPTGTYNAATSVFMNCLTTATADFNSLEIPAGALYETPAHHSGTGACSFISATANTPVYVREF